MLEFQEGFFDQEVRDGFYLDTTMKTLWAAELEVLQKVAEVCDRHGLKWYAAYGTLLGAIRHEGFVPWDDDMDIWVKRPDYNILMQVLPKELPEGYLVRGPLTDEGYDQYHTCLNSGNGISIAKEWLEQYHGCPFTVGLDIFPLDYLPRNEKDRKLQEDLIAMTGRIAQLAKNVGRGDYNTEDDRTEENSDSQNEICTKTLKESVIEEINLGIDYLEENCKLQINHQLLEDEDWYKLSSELWKWANYLAMMYGEEESDFLVEYLDYIQGKHRIYPKEWFADGYSALFENFMLPVPAGYDNILICMYGDYNVRQKKAGTHEYPYYARQLRQLREYVKGIEERAQKVGWITIDEIEVKKESIEIPKEWVPYTLKEDGSRKKIILSANNPVFYAKDGKKILNQIEKTLKIFEKEKDSVLLWWRPHPVMGSILGQISTELSERYQQILNEYREAGWGVCDETDNIDCAINACDAYYGDLNAIIQPFQNEGKPVLLYALESETVHENKNNRDRVNEYRTFISFVDFVEESDKVYFSNTNYNAMVIMDKLTGKVEQLIPFENVEYKARNVHLRCVKKQNKICFLPAGAQFVHIYDIENQLQYSCRFLSEEAENLSQETWDYFDAAGEVYLLPSHGEQGIWKWKVEEDSFERQDWWDIMCIHGALKHGSMDEECFYTLEKTIGRLWIVNVTKQNAECFDLPDRDIYCMTYGGGNFWYSSSTSSTGDIICWNSGQGVVDKYIVESTVGRGWMQYLKSCYANDILFLLSWRDQTLYVLNRNEREVTPLYSFECTRGNFFGWEMEPRFFQLGDVLICMLKNAGEIIRIDLKSLDVWQESVNFYMTGKEKEYEYQILFAQRGVLLEESKEIKLDMLLRY